MREKEILDRISQGDESALDTLYKKYYRMMVKMIILRGGTEQEAKDIYQDALIVFWQKAVSGELVLTSKVSTYLYSICLNLWRKESDRKSRHSREEKDGEEFQDFEQKEKIRIIHECIAALGDTCRKILTYYYFDGLAMNEIAKKLDFANSDTVKTKKYKCKKRLDELVRSKYSSNDFMD